MASGGKKKAKSKGKTIALNVFLQKEDGSVPTHVATSGSSSWATEMDNADLDDAEELRPAFDRSKLPTAPKAARGSDVDMERISNTPPFTAFVGNLPYDACEEKIFQFFENRELQVLNVRLPNENGRQRGFGYVEFARKEDLVNALSFNEEMFNGRKLRVDLAESSGGDRERPDNQGRSDRNSDWRGGGGDPDRAEGDWRRKDPPSFANNDRGGFDDRGGDRYGDRGGDRFGDRGGDRFGDRGGDRYGDRGGDRYGDRDRGFGNRDRDRRGFSDRGNDRYGDGGFGGGRFGDRDSDRYGSRGFSDRGGRDGYDRRDGGGFDDRRRGGGFDDRRDGGGFDDRRRGGGFDDRRGGGGFDDRRGGGFDDRRGGGGGFDDRRGGGRYDDRRDGDRYGGRNDDRGYGGRRDGGFRRDDDGGRYGRDDRGGSRDGSQEAPKERPRLNLQPRSKPVETSAGGQSRQSSIFGSAKPVDTATKEREIEEKMKKLDVGAHYTSEEASQRDREGGRTRRDSDKSDGGRSGGRERRLSNSSGKTGSRRDSESSRVSDDSHVSDRDGRAPARDERKMVPAPPPKENAWSRPRNDNISRPSESSRQASSGGYSDRDQDYNRRDNRRSSDDGRRGGYSRGQGSGQDYRREDQQESSSHRRREKQIPRSLEEMPKWSEGSTKNWADTNKYAAIMDDDHDRRSDED